MVQSAFYDERRQEFKNDQLDLDELGTPDELPGTFWEKVSHEQEGDHEFDRRMIQYDLRHAARKDDPFENNRVAGYFRPTHFADDLVGGFYEHLQEHHGRAFVFFHGVKRSIKAANPDCLRTVMERFAAEGLREELFEVLTYHRIGPEFLGDAPPSSEAGKLAKEEIKEEGRASFNQQTTPIYRLPDDQKIAQLLFIYPEWWDKLRAQLLRMPTVQRGRYSSKSNLYRLPDAVLRTLSTHQEEGGLKGRGGFVPDHVRAMDKTREALMEMKGWADNKNDQLFDQAATGLTGSDYDQLVPIFEQKNVEALRTWEDAGGSFRVYELYRAAEHAFDDEAVVRFIHERYDADQGQLNTALERAIKGIGRADNTRTVGAEDAFAAADFLIEQGADSEQEPTLTSAYLAELYKNSLATPDQFELLNEMTERFGPIDNPELRQFYHPDKLPDILTKVKTPFGAEIFDPLVQHGLYPTEEQIQALSGYDEQLADKIIERLPERRQKAAATLRTKTA